MGPAIGERITALEQAVTNNEDPRVMAFRISERSDQKKYNFCGGLQRDLQDTRHALRHCCIGNNNQCTFETLFRFTEGQIANLNRVLQNLKRAGEVHFESECFFMGTSCAQQEEIFLLAPFFDEPYSVDSENVHRAVAITSSSSSTTSSSEQANNAISIPRDQRRGRSYEAENMATLHQHVCLVCQCRVKDQDRITVRCHVFHLKCLACSTCGASLRRKLLFMAFDGGICCSSDCIRHYDGVNIHQIR